MPTGSDAKWLDDELEDPEPERRPDPTRGMRRLALAVLLQAATDFLEVQDPRIRNGARSFLFPQDADRAEYLRWTVEVSDLNPTWFRTCLARASERAPSRDLHTCKNCGPLPVENFRVDASDGCGRLRRECNRCIREKGRARARLVAAGIIGYRRRPALLRNLT